MKQWRSPAATSVQMKFMKLSERIKICLDQNKQKMLKKKYISFLTSSFHFCFLSVLRTHPLAPTATTDTDTDTDKDTHTHKCRKKDLVKFICTDEWTVAPLSPRVSVCDSRLEAAQVTMWNSPTREDKVWVWRLDGEQEFQKVTLRFSDSAGEKFRLLF